MTDTEQAQAACMAAHDVTVADFYRSGGGRVPSALRALCESCPVRNACLEDALQHEGDAPRHLRFGVWAGTTPAERHTLALKRRPAPVGVPA